MKAIVSALIVTVFSATVFAAPAPIKTINSAGAVPAAVVQSLTKLASDTIRLELKAVKGEVGDPCMPAGKSYNVEIQVRNQVLGDIGDQGAQYVWETVKTLNIDKDGRVMELCQE